MLTYEERARKLIHLDEETKIFLQGIRIARKQQGLTYRTLAQKLSINKNLISSYEYGKVFPKVGVFCELAEFFNLDISNNINYVFLNYPRKIVTELKRLKNHYGFSVREIAGILRKDRREILDMLNMNNQASPKIFAELLMLFNQEKHREHLINTLLSPIHKKEGAKLHEQGIERIKSGLPVYA